MGTFPQMYLYLNHRQKGKGWELNFYFPLNSLEFSFLSLFDFLLIMKHCLLGLPLNP